VAADEREVTVREAWAKSASDGLTYAKPNSKRAHGVAAARNGAGARLANTVLGYLPLGVAVINANVRLLFWNEHAARLFGVSPLMAAEIPSLAEILKGVIHLTEPQRDGIIAFAATHIAAGDRTDPDSCLRISLGRDVRIGIQVYGIGSDRWMLVIDDGKLAVAAGRNPSAHGGGVAWLDALTGLSNRRHFNDVLRDLVDHAEADSRHTVLMIDLDGFKSINDTLGHSIGDALLCLVAQRLRRVTRDEDLLVRLGGDEFVILLPNTERAEPLAARVVDILSRPFLVEGNIVTIGASLGIARFPEHGASGDDLMRYAELALYEAKRAGRRTWRVFEPAMAAEALARRDLETGLRKALAMGELSLAYQPQLNIRTQTLTGFEALLRWNHPVLGNVPPVVFIPVAEEIGCIVALGEWVLRTACQEAARWPAPLSVAVNVSPRQLQDEGRLFKAVEAALESSGLAAERLELEITESSLLSPVAAVFDTLHRLRASGVHIAMDDFGTGYSSLSQLRSFPFNKIKIDRSFVADLAADGEAAAMISAIAALGAGLGMTTIAEGVETPHQADLVGTHGCTDIQGYLLSQPMPAAEIDAFLIRFASASHDSTKTL
jgi:diguanylate cyclase (GGDEF)-like protein